MELNVRDDRKLVEVWLTKAEKTDLKLRESLTDIYEKFKREKYLVAVYESGHQDLYQNTLDLLKWNKHRFAELEVLREKQQHAAEAEQKTM